jgi:hypothetical protein
MKLEGRCNYMKGMRQKWPTVPKTSAAIRESGTACTVCVACTLIFLERFCKL